MEWAIAALKWLGISLREVKGEENARPSLYFWVTPDDTVLYVGKAESPTRVANEQRWLTEAKQALCDRQMCITFPLSLMRCQARVVKYQLGTTSLRHAKELLCEKEWIGPAVDRFLADDRPLSLRDVEYLLVRLCVNAGAALQNASGTGGWGQSLDRREEGQVKWTAKLGPRLSNEELDKRHPDFPYRVGDPCPTKGGGAYRPEYY